MPYRHQGHPSWWRLLAFPEATNFPRYILALPELGVLMHWAASLALSLASFDIEWFPPHVKPQYAKTNTEPFDQRHTAIMGSAPAQRFKVADISLAAFGRREIEKCQV